MALQRLKNRNYDTDVFTHDCKSRRTFWQKYEGILENEKDIAIRVVVDHIRAVAFAIADGQLPLMVVLGYVICEFEKRAISVFLQIFRYERAFFI